MPIRLPFRPRPDVACGPLDELPELQRARLQQAARAEPARLPAMRTTTSGCASTRALAHLLDSDSFEERDAGSNRSTRSGFVDLMAYPDKVREQRAKTGIRDAAVWGVGRIGGQPRRHLRHGLRLHGRLDGLGRGREGHARRGGGAASAPALRRHQHVGRGAHAGGHPGAHAAGQDVRRHRAPGASGVPYISVMSDPTTGGVFASFAALGDVNLAEPNALIGFAGARVAAGTTGDELPEGFQSAEFLFRHGFLDEVVPRAELRDAADAAAALPAAAHGRLPGVEHGQRTRARTSWLGRGGPGGRAWLTWMTRSPS